MLFPYLALPLRDGRSCSRRTAPAHGRRSDDGADASGRSRSRTSPRPASIGPPWFLVYVLVFLVHWTLLSVVVTVRLWRAGREQPAVAASRMRMLAFAAATLTLAIIGTAFASDQDSAGALLVQIIALVELLRFHLGLSPPQIVRAYWRTARAAAPAGGDRGLMTLATDDGGGRRSECVGAGRRARRRPRCSDRRLRRHRRRRACAPGGRGRAARRSRSRQPGATLIVWTSPYAPFFGDDELRILRDRGRAHRDRARPRAAVRAGARRRVSRSSARTR